MKKAAVLIFANKQDIKGAMSAAEISQQLSLTSVKQHPWHIQACCALTGEGLVIDIEKKMCSKFKSKVSHFKINVFI